MKQAKKKKTWAWKKDVKKLRPELNLVLKLNGGNWKKMYIMIELLTYSLK